MILPIEQQQAIKPIDENNLSRFDQISLEVENTVLRDLIGYKILQDIQTNPEDHTLLLDGDTFTDCNGNEIRHRGLYFCLAYWVYEKYIGQSFIFDSFTGFVQKTRPDSQTVNEGTIKRLQKENRQIAMSEWLLIDMYLREKNDKYKDYYTGQQIKPYLPKFRGIRRTGDNQLNKSYDLKTRTFI